jgi:hypothetical protein
MKPNYKRLGDHIEEVKVRNSDIKAEEQSIAELLKVFEELRYKITV